MDTSKHNIISRIRDTNEFYLINLLSGNAEILTEEETKQFLSGNYSENKEFIEKGYIIDIEEEKRLYRQKYLDFIDNRENDEIQLFFVSTYACNFRCSYCYQSGYDNQPVPLKKEIIDSFFEYILKQFHLRRKYITLFGGEPLLNGSNYREQMAYFFEKCKSFNIDLSIVTNGYYIEEYIEDLKKVSAREIQVTLDGMPEMHNNRRYIKKGEDTFQKISRGIDLLLENGIPVNLRVVLDKENIPDLPVLAAYAIEKKWTADPLFKTQLGRNYELHFCQSGNSKIFSRLEMHELLYTMLKSKPEILDFHKPAYSISKYLFDNGKLPEPLFDACPGCKTEWAFDYLGNIYSCTATVGKSGEKLGTFYPRVSLDEDKISQWEQRDILTIDKCKDCEVQLACGGGCASIAGNTRGNILSPDCRPVKELIGLGISLYK